MQWDVRNFGKIWVDQMSDDINKENLEDNLPMVNYIMLHRIYDMMTIIANHFDAEKAGKMVEYHEQGYLLGPAPAFTPLEQEENNAQS